VELQRPDVGRRFKVIAKERQVDLPQAWTISPQWSSTPASRCSSRAELEVLRNVLQRAGMSGRLSSLARPSTTLTREL